MASVFLADLDADFIAPSQSCTNPLFSSDTQSSSSATAVDSSQSAPGGKAKLDLAMEIDDGIKPDLIRSVTSNAPALGGASHKTKATVSLNDCLACSGRVTSAETVLINQQSKSKYFEALESSAYGMVVISTSPQSRSALAAHLRLPMASFLPRFTTFWKGLGAHYVTDTSVAADLTLVETAAEFVARYRQRQPRKWAPPETSVAISADRSQYPDRTRNTMDLGHGSESSTNANDIVTDERSVYLYTSLPMLASACPGWVCYAEKTQPNVLPYISTVKSPQQAMGSVLKLVLSRQMQIDPSSIFHVTVMPCFDKKLEASRRDFYHESEGFQEVDLVLTTTEVLEMLTSCATESKLDPTSYFIALSETPLPSPADPIDGLLRSNWIISGQGLQLLSAQATIGGSGGYLEYVFRYAAKELFGVIIDANAPLAYRPGRNDDIKELVLEKDGKPVLTFAIAYGFRNIQSVIQKMRRGRLPYEYVEVMACPSGCLNGGGQIKNAGPETNSERRARVAQTQASFDENRVAREPHESPLVGQLYSTILGGKPFSDAARKLLHTTYHNVPKMETTGPKW